MYMHPATAVLERFDYFPRRPKRLFPHSMESLRQRGSIAIIGVSRCDNVKIIISSRNGDSEVSEFLDSCPSITITSQAMARDNRSICPTLDRSRSKALKQARSEYMVDRLTSGAEGMYEQDIQFMCQPMCLL